MSSAETGRESSHGGSPGQVSALRSATFRLLTVVWVAANLADSLLALILAVWVKDLTGSDAAAGLTLAALGLPALATPLIGQLVDRISRRRVLIVAYLIGAVALMPLLAVHDAGTAWVVFAVTIVYATVGYATGAAQSGLLRDLLPDSDLAPANGRLTTIDQAFRLVMPIVGALVYTVVGPRPLVIAAALAFVTSALLATRLRVRETPPNMAREPFRREVSAGFRHLRRTPPLGRLAVALGLGFGVTGLVNGVAFAIVDRLGLPAAALGPITSAQAVTAVAAGLTASRLITRFGAPRLVTGGLALACLGVVPLLGTSIVGVVLGMGAIGAGVTWSIVGFVTERQVRTPAGLQGRVQAAGAVLLNLPQVLLALLAASLVDAVDYRLLVAVAVGGLAVAAVLAGRDRTGRAEARGSHGSDTRSPEDVVVDGKGPTTPAS